MTSCSLVPTPIPRAPHTRTLVLGTAGILEDDVPGPTNRCKHPATLPAQLLLESAARGASGSRSHLPLPEIPDTYMTRLSGCPGHRLVVLVGPDKTLPPHTWLGSGRWHFLSSTPLQSGGAESDPRSPELGY